MIKIYDLNEVPEEEIFARQEEAVDVSAPVADILRAVKERGDAALLEYEKQFDRVELSALEVTPQELEEGAAQVDPEFTQILREAAENIRAFHAKQKREGFLMTEREGVVLGQKITPLARVGIYVPGGTAASWRAKISSSGTSLRSYIFIMEHTSQILGQGVPHGEDLLVFELIAHLVADKPGADVHDGLQRGQVVLP